MRKEPILELFKKIKPKTLLESGTWLGEGSTRIILDCLNELKLPKWQFYTIESNVDHYNQAKKNLENDNVTLIYGMSIPKSLLPDRNYISDLINKMPSSVMLDHNPRTRIDDYFNSTDLSVEDDDIIGKLMDQHDGSFDLILLDSSGHIGEIEFDYLMSKIKSSCYMVLDDVNHIKHYRNFEKIKLDPRFEIVEKFDERFGWAIVKYNHPEEPKPKVDKKETKLSDKIDEMIDDVKTHKVDKKSSPKKKVSEKKEIDDTKPEDVVKTLKPRARKKSE